MATYDPKQVLADYATGRITPEMAVGHSLQHIEQLYATQTSQRQEWRGKTDALEKRVNHLQTAVDRLTALMEKVLSKRKKPNAPGQPRLESLAERPDQP